MPRQVIALLLAALSASAAHAGAWLQPKNHGLLINQATTYTASHYFDSNNNRHRQARYTKYEYQPYIEYGALDNLTIGSSAYLQQVVQSGSSNRGIADPELFVRTRLWHDDTQILSIQPLVTFKSSYDKTDSPRGGGQSTDAELSLLYGRNQPLLSKDDYTDLRVGYRVRGHGLSDQLRVDASTGIKLGGTFEVVPAVRAVLATQMREEATYSESGDQDFSVLKAEVTGIYHLTREQWLHASLFKHVAGIQTGDGYGVTIGFAQQF